MFRAALAAAGFSIPDEKKPLIRIDEWRDRAPAFMEAVLRTVERSS